MLGEILYKLKKSFIICNMIEQYPFTPTYEKENGLWLLNVDKAELPDDFLVVERNVVCIPAGEAGGNHMHPREEALVGIGEGLQLIWEDTEGKRHAEVMSGEEGMKLFVIRSLTPHAVVNRGATPAVLIEFANDVQHDVVPVDLLDS